MTREETLKHFKTWCQQTLGNNCSDKDMYMANNIIALLEQEPCEDAISRKKVIDTIYCECSCENLDIDFAKVLLLHRAIKALSPVTPQPKMGKWKAFTHSAYHGNDEDGEPIWREVTVYHCNLCNRRTVIKEKYCPKCGCKMQEVKE